MSEINILAVIDTDYLKKALAGSYSTDPTRVPGVYGEYLLITGTTINNNSQGTRTLDFNAKPGDEVSFRGISMYGNSEDAVIIYKIESAGAENVYGGHVFNRFVPNVVTRSKAALPDPKTDKGLPVLHMPVNFTSFDSKVIGAGIEGFSIYFAIYQLAPDGESQELLTYCGWDPTIRVA